MNWLERRWYADRPAPCYLKPLAALYRFLSQRKQRKDLKQQWCAPVPVIIVGNISVGGTGKTPFTTYLIPLLISQGYKPGIISRGYKSQAPHYPFDVSKAESPIEAGDEPYLLYKRCHCPVIIGSDRVAAAQYLLSHYDCDLIISDDGLQHYRLGRDIEISLIDARRGLGNGAIMPAGPLREGPDRLAQVDYVVVNGDGYNLPFPVEEVAVMQLVPSVFKSCTGPETKSLNAFNNTSAHAVAGIGNPQRFFDLLKMQFSIKVIEHAKPDHYHYSEEDFRFDDNLPVLMTEKDAVKITEPALKNAWYLEVEAQLPEDFERQLLAKLADIYKQKGMKQNG